MSSDWVRLDIKWMRDETDNQGVVDLRLVEYTHGREILSARASRGTMPHTLSLVEVLVDETIFKGRARNTRVRRPYRGAKMADTFRDVDVADDEDAAKDDSLEALAAAADAAAETVLIAHATAAVEAILADMTDRRGFRHQWDNCDEDIQEEIRETWRQRIIAAMRPAPVEGQGSPSDSDE